MITLRDLLAFGIGLLVGASGGAGAMWAVAKPLIDLARVERDNARLERRVVLLDAQTK